MNKPNRHLRESRSADLSAACADAPGAALPQQPMYIGALARLTGTTPKAIRLYESLGLLGAVGRSGVYRVYGPRHVRQVRLIKQAQAMGFRLSALVPSLQVPAGQPDWVAMAHQVTLRREELAREIARLRKLDAQLVAIRAELLSCDASTDL